MAWDKISYVRSINKKVLQPSGHLGTYTKISKLSYDEKLPKIYFETFFPKTLERVLDVNITCQNEVKGKKIQFYSLPLHNGPNVHYVAGWVIFFSFFQVELIMFRFTTRGPGCFTQNMVN